MSGGRVPILVFRNKLQSLGFISSPKIMEKLFRYFFKHIYTQKTSDLYHIISVHFYMQNGRTWCSYEEFHRVTFFIFQKHGHYE